MDHEHNLTVLGAAIAARGLRERATTEREFVLLSLGTVEREQTAEGSREITQPIKLVHLADL